MQNNIIVMTLENRTVQTFSVVQNQPAVVRREIVEVEVATYLHPAALQWASGSNVGLAQRRPASASHPEAIGGKLSLWHWRRQCDGIKLAIGGQSQ